MSKQKKKRRKKGEGPELTDSYVKKLLCAGTSLKHADIPDGLVELKREHIKVGRLIKKKLKG